jgi:uncharacterized membrane protein
MPYEWVKEIEAASEKSGAAFVSTAPDTLLAELHLWPHTSLPKTGFATFIGITAAMITLPLLAVLGSPVLWALLPFVVLAVAGIWWALQRSYRDGNIHEHLRITPQNMTLHRKNPRAPDQSWAANPYWVDLSIHPTGGPVAHYITLRGGEREVELGAFLSADERLALFDDLSRCLARARTATL